MKFSLVLNHSTFHCGPLSEINVILVELLSLHGTCHTGAHYIKLTASNNSTVFHSITERTDFPAESPQIQFFIEN